MAQGIRWDGSCSIPGCVNARKRREWCLYHYMRWYRCGDPLASLQRIRHDDPNRPKCRVVGCDEPFLANAMCRRHNHNAHTIGSPVSPNYEWAPETPCKVCGECENKRFRQFCSQACRHAWKTYGDAVLVGTQCVRCSASISFLGRTPTGRRTYRIRSYCQGCRRRYTRWGMSVAELAVRDGSDCAICQAPIDLALSRPDPGGFMCASVDHILPRSGGGTDDPTNLQLTHLLCNVRKGGVRRTQP